MNKLIRNACLALAVAASSVTFSPIVTSAQGVQLEIGQDGVRVRERDRDEERYERRGRGRDRGGDCSQGEALDKAARMGIRRARIIDIRRRSIEVAGRRDGRRVEVRFARDRRCSVIR